MIWLIDLNPSLPINPILFIMQNKIIGIDIYYNPYYLYILVILYILSIFHNIYLLYIINQLFFMFLQIYSLFMILY